MTSAVAEPRSALDLSVYEDAFADFPGFDPDRVPGHLVEASPGSWLWCFGCEHAFQVFGAASDLECPTPECDANPADLWQWDAYVAFAGDAIVPAELVRYPLAA
jgi:hypothetical protein